ncbi:MAG: septum site-determining protein MinC [Bacillota bacterium]
MKRDGFAVQSKEGRNLIVIDEHDSFSKVKSKLERIVALEGVIGGERLDIDFGRRLLDSDQVRKIKKVLEPVPGVVHIIHGQNEDILYKKTPAQTGRPSGEAAQGEPDPPPPATEGAEAGRAKAGVATAAEVAVAAPKAVVLEPPGAKIAPATPAAVMPGAARAQPPHDALEGAFPSGPGPLFTIQSGRARPRPQPERVAELPPAVTEAGTPPPDDDAMILRRTLRSGQVIHYPGHVTIIGDVNPGGEVIAGGDIIVLGVLRGIAHAGGGGNDQAVVAAFRLRPTQLRIGNHIARAPDEETSGPEMPEIAKVRNGVVVIEPYHGLGE